MLIQPKGIKYRKSFKGGRIKGRETLKGEARTKLTEGEYGLRSRERGRLSARQVEAGRRVRRHHRDRSCKVWVKVFPDVPVTKKPLEVRMGKGKGSVEYWAVHVRPGTRRYEVGGVDEKTAEKALVKAGKKRPVRTNRVKRR
jgi:large subunit ribosomal protein L16